MEKISKIIDLLFKIAIILIAILLLKNNVNSNNSRYQAFSYNVLQNVIDTRTGDIYIGDYDESGFYSGIKIDFVEKIDSLNN